MLAGKEAQPECISQRASSGRLNCSCSRSRDLTAINPVVPEMMKIAALAVSTAPGGNMSFAFSKSVPIAPAKGRGKRTPAWTNRRAKALVPCGFADAKTAKGILQYQNSRKRLSNIPRRPREEVMKMAVFRVERNTGYTVMSNHHLRNKELTLKAKGLLSQMLSLPEDWDYTLAGLSHINREKIDAIREAVKELEKAGYIVRSRERDEKGRLRGADYVIYEQPQPREPEAATSGEQPPISDLPTLENPTLDNPTLEKPTQEKPTLENPTQLNKDISSKEQSITDLSSTHSIPFHSLNPLPFAQGEAATPPERKRTEAKSNSAVEIYREIIKDNIEYDHLIQNCKIDKDRLDEIVDLMLETVCTARKTIRIAGDDYPAELVKSKFLKLNSSHIEFVLDCMRENTTKVRNIKQYLKAVLFNAPSTIDSYYTALVNHDLYGGE